MSEELAVAVTTVPRTRRAQLRAEREAGYLEMEKRFPEVGEHFHKRGFPFDKKRREVQSITETTFEPSPGVIAHYADIVVWNGSLGICAYALWFDGESEDYAEAYDSYEEMMADVL